MSRKNSRAAFFRTRFAAVGACVAVIVTAAAAAGQTVPPPSVAQATKAAAQAVAKPADPVSVPAAAPAAQAVPAPGAGAPTPEAAQQPGSPTLLVPGSDFKYDPAGRRDPFKSLLQLEAKKRDVNQLPPIQQFDLDTVKVVGVVIDPVRGAQAMIRAPNGQTFVVRKGTIVGKNDGEIVEITMQGIRLVEKFLDFMNRETRKETFLKSHPTAGK